MTQFFYHWRPNRFGAMETGNHSKKRGESEKPTSRGNFNTMVVAICTATLMATSCVPVYHSKLKADVIGFSDNVIASYLASKQSEPYDLLPPSGDEAVMKKQVLGLKSGSNTAAYYALDLGLDRVKKVRKSYMEKDPNSKYYIIMLTDGLDNISMSLKKGKYASADAYTEALQKKMSTVMGTKPNAFQSYVLLYKGEDLKESEYTDDDLEKKLSVFTGSQNTGRPGVLMAEDLETLLAKFKAEFTVASFDFEIPKDYAGKRIRMLLNNEKEQYRQVYFEADFVKSGRYFRLENIGTSNGFSVEIPKNRVIEMTNKEIIKSSDTKASFTVRDLRLNNAAYSVDKDAVSQWFEDTGKFRKNSEYQGKSTDMKNAYIMVILDTSTSFGTQINKAKETIIEIVNFISKKI
ncbi:MAG: hypothetical protein LBG92_04335 [Prevotellaceae bacterium]|jgi:Mg-chelatase subunit ChlD|nr:hypothetical protein [Prevotellaceae bacterium]